MNLVTIHYHPADPLHPFYLTHDPLPLWWPLIWPLYVRDFVVFCFLYFRFHIRVISDCICLSLTYFNQCNTLNVYSCYCKWQDFTPFYDRVAFIVHIHHILFIYSSISGHWGCFQILVFVNNTAVYMGKHPMQSQNFLFRARHKRNIKS